MAAHEKETPPGGSASFGPTILLFGVGNDAEDSVGGTDNTKIKSVASIHPSLPHIRDLIVFLGAERGMAEVLAQKLKLLKGGFAQARRQLLEIPGGTGNKLNIHFLPMSFL
jgi:hypothetical protein